MKRFKILTILILCFSLLVSPTFGVKKVLAMDFDPNEIISDSDLQDYGSMDLAEITEFLNSQDGVLKNLLVNDYAGIPRVASEIIYNAAQMYHVSPRWILATLQKEQSLITNPTPSQRDLDWAMGYAVCDSCSTDDPQIAMFKGFGTQVDRATWRIRYYYDHPNEFNYRMGQSCSIDNKDVIPLDQATANLYNYTPHLNGNYNFWDIWNRWFAKSFPDGSLLRQQGDEGVWLIENGQRRPFWSKTALVSRFDEKKVVTVTKNDLQRYDVGYPIKYPNYSLLKSPAGDIYLIVNSQKKEIESDEVFRAIGYNYDEVIEVSDEELAHYEDGREITLDSMYPQGALLQDKKTGGVFYVEDGIKYPVLGKEVLQANYKKYILTKVSTDELDKYVTAANGLKLRDGTLIKTADDPKVYVISNGQRRWLANEQTFTQLGYKWTDIMLVKDKVAELHPMGDPINLIVPPVSKIASN